MRRALLLSLAVLAGCDFLPAKDRSVVLLGTVVDAQTAQPVEDMLWIVETTSGFGSTRTLASGRTDGRGAFRAEYEYPIDGDPTLEINGAVERGYLVSAQQVYGMGKTIRVTVRLGKRG